MDFDAKVICFVVDFIKEVVVGITVVGVSVASLSDHVLFVDPES